MRYRIVAAGFVIVFVGAAPDIPVPMGPDEGDSPSAGHEFVTPTVRILTAVRTSNDDKTRVKFVCSFTHVNKQPVKVPGYSFDIEEGDRVMQPLYKIELQRAGKWENHPLGWCGNELINSKVSAGSRGIFQFSVPLEPAWTAVRVGVPFSDPRSLPWSGHPLTRRPISPYAWSKPLTLEQIDAAGGKEIRSD